jgi:phospholipase/carboxylesterase
MDYSRTPDEEVELGSLVIETGDMPEASVIWLHGLGADGHDFEDVVPQLLIPASMPIRFIFPDAPVRAVTINGGYMMRAWYDIYDDISPDAEQDEEGIKSAATLLGLLVEQEMERGIASERIVLAGFSQGGAVALYAGLTSDRPLAGIMALSAYLPLSQQLTETTTRPGNIPSVFMAHGEYDSVIPLAYARASQQHLKQLDVPVDWNIYNMEHNMSADEIFAIREWLIERLA